MSNVIDLPRRFAKVVPVDIENVKTSMDSVIDACEEGEVVTSIGICLVTTDKSTGEVSHYSLYTGDIFHVFYGADVLKENIMYPEDEDE